MLPWRESVWACGCYMWCEEQIGGSDALVVSRVFECTRGFVVSQHDVSHEHGS